MNNHRSKALLAKLKIKKAKANFLIPAPINYKHAHPTKSIVTVYDYNQEQIKVYENVEPTNLKPFNTNSTNTWINIDILNKEVVELLASQFNVHYLMLDHILSTGHRAKFEEIEDTLFLAMNMLFFNSETLSVEHEQISFVLCENTLLSFQEDARRDVFGSLREKIMHAESRIRSRKSDYLLYALMDLVIDNYFLVLSKLGEQIEVLEEQALTNPSQETLNSINFYRNEMLALKRYISPVRELLFNLVKKEHFLIDETSKKYFRDLQDHVTQAYELVENYRDMLLNTHDLYISQVNLKMNEIMKVLAIVTTLLAPLTVIVGIYGMNFKNMPELDNPYGYFICLGILLSIFIGMLFFFKRRGWF